MQSTALLSTNTTLMYAYPQFIAYALPQINLTPSIPWIIHLHSYHHRLLLTTGYTCY